jgi:hypothetical protein
MKYLDRLRVWESNYGRSLGWDLELDGRVVGLMDEPRPEDMFWVSYRVRCTVDDVALSRRLLSEEFWKGDGYTELVFRSRATGLVAEQPFPATGGFVEPHRVSMRALYIGIPEPAPWDRVVLKLRSLVGAGRTSALRRIAR